MFDEFMGRSDFTRHVASITDFSAQVCGSHRLASSASHRFKVVVIAAVADTVARDHLFQFGLLLPRTVLALRVSGAGVAKNTQKQILRVSHHSSH